VAFESFSYYLGCCGIPVIFDNLGGISDIGRLKYDKLSVICGLHFIHSLDLLMANN
jgi:hypothetical protein